MTNTLLAINMLQLVRLFQYFLNFPLYFPKINGCQ